MVALATPFATPGVPPGEYTNPAAEISSAPATYYVVQPRAIIVGGELIFFWSQKVKRGGQKTYIVGQNIVVATPYEVIASCTAHHSIACEVLVFTIKVLFVHRNSSPEYLDRPPRELSRVTATRSWPAGGRQMSCSSSDETAA